MATLESSSSSTPQILFDEPHSGIAMRRKDSGWIGLFYNPGLAIASDMKLGFVPNNSSGSFGSAHDAFFMRSSGASIQMGENHATTATDQTFKAHDVTTSFGAALTLKGGTGADTPGASILLEGGGNNLIKLRPDGTNDVLAVSSGNIELADGTNISFGATNGTIIGTSTVDKIAFWGASPIAQPAHVADPSGDAGTGSDTVDLATLNSTLDSIITAVSAINARFASLGLTAAS